MSETIVHFVIYEQIKAQLQLIQASQNRSPDDPDLFNFVSYLGAAACSKSCASTMCYPHEVLRTRLREHGTKYRTLIQTFQTVLREEGFAGFYRGLLTHLIRQIPVSRSFSLRCQIRCWFFLLEYGNYDEYIRNCCGDIFIEFDSNSNNNE